MWGTALLLAPCADTTIAVARILLHNLHRSGLLVAIEEARGEEYQRNHEGELGTRPRMEVELNSPIHSPHDTSDEPYPRGISHRCNIGRQRIANS